ncbi:MMS22-like [Brachionus plicatilis]|uniref:Protein MMS22-like n=1 Tax=Brachionus plicatilis TaxID=10195 RepID=A0A3M7T641_BRAPC|nr:MMS22-like [Brachionus plicatilis]
MRISCEDVNQFLELNVHQRFEESNEFLESLMLSGIDCAKDHSINEYDIDYFMIYEQNPQVYFNRIRSFIYKLINFPPKITKFSDSVGNFIYSLIVLTNKLINLVNDEQINDFNVEMSFYYKEILDELKKTLVVLGNWKNLNNNFLDSKCLIKEKALGDSVYALGFHTVLSVQNIILYLIYLLSQKLFSCQNSSMAMVFDFCSLNDHENQETCLFTQTLHFFINNLIQLSLHTFKKVSDMENLYENYQEMCCECVNKCWYFGYKIGQLFEKEAKIQQEQNNQQECKNYLDPCYQIIKSSMKEITEQNQVADQKSFNHIRIPLQMLCHEMESNSPQSSYIELSQIFSSNPSMSQSNPNSRKIFVDILLMLWESYFSKLINSSFFVQTKGTNSLFALNESQASLTDFKSGLKVINQITKCQIDQSNNIFQIFLSFLFTNLKDGNTGSMSSSSGSSNLVWRQFKGRLYTRLHDKRIAELDMSGFLNISYLFFTLIKCFSNSADLVTSQLKYEQFENFFRILNVFIKSKNMNKIEHVLSLNSSNVSYSSVVTSSKANALKIFLNMKFLALKLWYDSVELENEENSNVYTLLNDEFSLYLNNIVQEANLLIQNDQNSNQISNFKNSQVVGQFLTDYLVCFVDNCQNFISVNDSKVNLYLYQISLIICRLLNEIKFDTMFKLLSRKQNELIFSKISETLAIYKKIFQNELSNYTFNTKLSEMMSEFLKKLWSILIDQQSTLNKSSVFSYESMSFFGYQICSLYSHLIFNPASLVQNTTKEMKSLVDMIDYFALTTHIATNSNHQTNIEDHCQSVMVRLKFIELVLNDQELEQICQKNLHNFELKIFNLIIFAFINSTCTQNGPKDFFDLKESNTPQSDRILSSLINTCQNKMKIFKDSNLTLNSDVEHFLIDFISKFAQNLRIIQSLAEKKNYLENLNVYFADFLKLVQSVSSIASHSVLYKTYIIASQIVYHLSTFIHSRGRSDTLFAKIIDRLVLPVGSNKTTNSKLNPNSLYVANNQNSILISLKDSLHLFLIGISQLNYEYDGYLQRVLQSIIANFTMKFQMTQVDDHFIVLALERTFIENCSSEILNFRRYIISLLKQNFLEEPKNNNETEKNNSESDEMFSKSIEEVVTKWWNYQEPNRMFVSLTLIAKQKSSLMTRNIKELILEKVEESQSKFRYNSELKNILFTLFEYIDGDEGKVYLNKRLGFLWY